ncbi:hypothetical protein D3C78_1137880 [compost metagenome]
MYGHDCSCPGRNLAPDIGRVHLPGVFQRVDEHRRGASLHDGVDRGDIGERRNDHFITGFYAKGFEGEVNGHRAVVHRCRVLCANELAECALEATDELTFRGDPRRVQALIDVLFLFTAERRLINRNHLRDPTNHS